MEYALTFLSRETAGRLDLAEPDLFDAPIRADSLAAFLDDPRHVLVMAEAAGQVVGFASGNEVLHPDKAPQLFINEVGVSPAFRRNGIGRAMVAALLDWARGRGCDCAWLGTALDNEAGNGCFASVPGAERAEDFTVYEWRLGP